MDAVLAAARLVVEEGRGAVRLVVLDVVLDAVVGQVVLLVVVLEVHWLAVVVLHVVVDYLTMGRGPKTTSRTVIHSVDIKATWLSIMALTTMPLSVASMKGIMPMNMSGGSKNTGDMLLVTSGDEDAVDGAADEDEDAAGALAAEATSTPRRRRRWAARLDAMVQQVLGLRCSSCRWPSRQPVAHMSRSEAQLEK
ncbi:Proto-oncogene vav, partial [Frankliniella fusca]